MRNGKLLVVVLLPLLLCCCAVPPTPAAPQHNRALGLISSSDAGGCVEKTLTGLPYPDGTIVELTDPSGVPLRQVVQHGQVRACLFNVTAELGTVQVARLGSSSSQQFFWKTQPITTTDQPKRRIVGRR